MVSDDVRASLFDGAPIVVFGSFAAYDWDMIRQRQQNIVEWLAERNEVFYIERLGATPMGLGRVVRALLKRRRSANAPHHGVQAVGPQPSAATPAARQPTLRVRFVRAPIIPAHGVRPVDKVNASSVLRAVRAAVAPWRLEEAVAFVFYPSPYVLEAVRKAGFGFVVHDAAHRYDLVPEVYGKNAGKIDAELARLADARSCDSRALLRMREAVGLDCLLLPQGLSDEFCGEASTADHPVLSRLRELRETGPVSGFVGAVSDVVDADLVNAYAEESPGTTVVVGPEISSPVGCLSNRVEHVGSVPGALVADVMRELDVGLVPYLVNERTDAVLPTKLVEYLAAGCSVVSTPLPEVVAVASEFPGVVRLETDARGWREAARTVGRRSPGLVDQHALRSRYSWRVLLQQYATELETRWAEAVGAR